MNRSEYLKEKARSIGLCDQWYKEWGDSNDCVSLIDKFVAGQDFCIEHNFPSLEDIERLFTRDELRSCGVYLNEKDVLVESSCRAIVLGDSSIRLDYGYLDVADIYIRHNSSAEIHVDADALVYINIYDNASVHVVSKGIHPPHVYVHGGSCTHDGLCFIRDRRNDGK